MQYCLALKNGLAGIFRVFKNVLGKGFWDIRTLTKMCTQQIYVQFRDLFPSNLSTAVLVYAALRVRKSACYMCTGASATYTYMHMYMFSRIFVQCTCKVQSCTANKNKVAGCATNMNEPG